MANLSLSFVTEIREFLEESYEMAALYGDLSLARIFTALITATVCGVIIYLVYRFFYRGLVFSENYNILLLLVTVVTAFIINTISANIVLSLGMVGALSIVRFRSAVKDPLDIGFLFWGIAAGVTSGAGLYFAAFVGTAFIAVLYILLVFAKVEKKSYLLIVKYEDNAEEKVNTLLSASKYKLKNKTRTHGKTELTVEIKIKKNDTDAVKKFDEVDGVEMVTLLEYSGEYMN
jgi:chromate transport protein ChrA